MAITYKDAGVDIDAGNALVDRIKPLAKSTMRPEVLGGIGGFAALCRLPTEMTELWVPRPGSHWAHVSQPRQTPSFRKVRTPSFRKGGDEAARRELHVQTAAFGR